ncbi:hypothetical protein JCM9279_001065 [Rhodotorula babjevae]
MGQGQSQQRTDAPPLDVASSNPPSPPHPHQPESPAYTPADAPAAQPAAPAPSSTTAADPADPGTAVVAALSATAPLAVEHDQGDTFKVPALPLPSTTTTTITTTSTSPSSTLRALPADIEHILSLGAADPDHAERAAASAQRGGGTSELEQVVRELRERADAEGVSKMDADGDEADGDELKKVEDEMRTRGVTRGAEVVEVKQENDEAGDIMESERASANKTAQVKMEDDDDSSDSDSSSSSDSDAAMEAALAPRQRNRRGKQRAAAFTGGGDSDLDDDDGESGVASSKTAPKTEHEVVEPDVAPPPVAKVDAQAEFARFGKVESVIETVVVVKADTGGDWRVLDEGTVVCWEDRTVIGTIFETFGSVQQPFYSIRFPSSSPPDPAVFTHARAVFYSPNLASFVFTRDLRKLKGSDASNIWDEEVAANELEFSDDEEEAEYKRKLKADRKARTQSATPGPSGSRNSRAPSTTPSLAAAPPRSSSSSSGPPSHLPARPAVSYADTADDFLTPSVPSAAPMNPGPGRAMVGTAPPPGRVGRRMFERDSGMALEEGEEVEFEFSSGEGSEGEEEGEGPSGGGFGGVRGGRGGRGGAPRGGAGQRGGATAGARGRGRGGRGGGAQATSSSSSPGGRPIAGMPRGRVPSGPPAPAGLPSKPAFEADFAMADGATDAPTRMSAPASSSASSTSLPPPPVPASSTAAPYSFGAPPTGAFTFGAPPSGPSATRSPPQPQPQPPQQPQRWTGAPPPPSEPSKGYSAHYGAAPTGPRGGFAGPGAYRAPPPPGPSHYYGGPPPSAYGYPSAPALPLGAGGYSPHAPYAGVGVGVGGGGGSSEGYNPIAVQGGGHLNPRFFAAQQQAQQGMGQGQGAGQAQGQRPGQGAGGGAQGAQGYYPAQGGQGGYGGQGRW